MVPPRVARVRGSIVRLRPVSGPPLEIELAVTRDREYLVRTVFRGPEPVSIGTNPRAAVALPDDQLPDFFELVHIDEGRARLAFESDMTVEWLIDGAKRPTADLISSGLATEGADAYQLELEAGSKGLVHFGALRVLLKVQAQRDVTIWSAAHDGGPACGGCGAPLKWALAAAGALSPCQRCGDLNRVAASIAALEGGATRAVPTFGGSEPATAPPRPPVPVRSGPSDVPSPEPPTVTDADAPAATDEQPKYGVPDAPVGPSGDLPTYDGIEGPRGADLPTFDGIQVGVAAEPPSAAALLAAERARPAPSDLTPGHGADLPTFDAISVFKGETDLSTRAAISVMRGAEDGEPPVFETGEQGGDGGPPARLGPAVPPPEEATDRDTPPPSTPAAAASATAPDEPAPEAVPADDSLTTPHKYPAPEKATDAIRPPTALAPQAEPAIPEPALESAPMLRTDAIGVPEEDFLMGRKEAGPRTPTTQTYVLGWVMVAAGLLAGLAGMGLMVVAGLRYKGLL